MSRFPIPAPTYQTFQFEIITVNVQGQTISRSPSEVMYFTENLEDGVALEMVSIPGGTFIMGSPEDEAGRDTYPGMYETGAYRKAYDPESPLHVVTISPFFMGKYLVTQAQWQVIAALPKNKIDLLPDPSEFKGDDCPVEMVSRHDAMEFCTRLSRYTGREYRLPSEAEWEFACRAGTATPFHFGETITSNLANYYGHIANDTTLVDDIQKQTTAVGSFPPNAFGLYDMHGNVSEWCLDFWHDGYQGAPTDGSAWVTDGDLEKAVIRGGSWNCLLPGCRSACRYWDDLALGYNYIGFRVICDSV